MLNKILFLCITLIWSVQSYRILAVFPMPSYSHYVVASKLLKELAFRGHNLTVISAFPQKTPVRNFRDIEVDNVRSTILDLKKNLYARVDDNPFSKTNFELSLAYILVEETLKNHNVQKLLHSDEQFDLIILEQFLNEGLMALASRFDVPIVLLTSMQIYSWGKFALKHPSPPSYVQNLLTGYTSRMTFWERLVNTMCDCYGILYYEWIVLPYYRKIAKQYIPGEPDLYNYLDKASLILTNAHPSVNDVFPQVPNIIEIGGIHIEPPTELTPELNEFLDNAEHGVIYFSMGSNLKTTDFPPDKMTAILKSFAQLKQRVLWKWEADQLPGLPSNVKQMKWLPQRDILAHPNVKAFITHGGLLSLMESVYNGVPLIGFPVFVDQNTNLAVAAAKGYAIKINFDELTEEKLTWALRQVVDNPKYKESAVKYSTLFRDYPVKPLDNAVYWIEFVGRHKGASHLRYAGMDLNWAQRNLLDVISFVALVLVGAMTLVYAGFKIILTVLRRGCVQKQKQQ